MNHKFIRTFDNDYKFLVDLFDYLEESRCLSPGEVVLRRDARDALVASTLLQAAFW